MDNQQFRNFYKSLMGGYYLPPETVKQLLGKILFSLSQKKKESEHHAR